MGIHRWPSFGSSTSFAQEYFNVLNMVHDKSGWKFAPMQRQKLDLAQLQGIQEFPTLAKVAGMVHSSMERADRAEAAMKSAKDALQDAVAGVSIFHSDEKLSAFPSLS